ncbi:CPBP family intramembrane metalloprotease [Asticcacaulis sp. ZE23SCel15]|uniref:CPBP family intramembrane glutamic endopeptidase n=1 Tax=Asticcacaulis sp. ZE23SCel15 TaxID=3059027 RepID=UPI00265D6654|nr:CPBP family intramembrane glutamic endopeptidase [Asticcacaulis sp. ZE23SCel15]WKL56559.1 CPBP family intramembrane metalloprotease [Asticcacaulis sp. ZE23SCel15]
MRLKLTLLMSLAAFGVWQVITIGGGQLMAGGQHTSLADSVSTGIGYNWLLAMVFVILVAYASGTKSTGLTAPATSPLKTLGLMWLPLLYLAAMLFLVLENGWPPQSVILFTLINTLMVGVSEEVMCRGVLFKGFLTRFTIWPSLILASIGFGLMHVLNVFITGDLWPAVLQASAAFMTGFGYMAVRIRTQSLWPMIIVHGLWDFLVFMAVPTHSATASAPASVNPLAPMMIAAPLFLYGLYLLRNAHRDYGFMSDTVSKSSPLKGLPL